MSRRWWTPVLVMLALVSACSGGADGDTDAPGDEPTTTTTAPPDTLPEGARQLAVDDLDTGDCFNLTAPDTGNAETVFWIPCEAPHDNEVFEQTVYQGEDAAQGEPYPGDVEVKDYAEGVCIEAFEGFVGVPWTKSDFDAQAFYPSQEDWEVAGNRDITCFLNSFYGEKLTGTMQGAGE